MKACSIFIVVALSLLSVVNALRDPETQERLNFWSEKLIGKELVFGEPVDFDEATQFRAVDLPTPNRVLRPRSAMTMDYRPDRLNVFIDSNNKVTKIGYF